MYLFDKIVYDCKQATFLALKREEGKITWIERLKLSYHLLRCDPCRKFIEQSAQINAAGRRLKQSLSSKPPFSLSDDAKESIQRQIDEHDM